MAVTFTDSMKAKYNDSQVNLLRIKPISRAATSPTAPPSVAVKIPKYIPPMTRANKVKTGHTFMIARPRRSCCRIDETLDVDGHNNKRHQQ